MATTLWIDRLFPRLRRCGEVAVLLLSLMLLPTLAQAIGLTQGSVANAAPADKSKKKQAPPAGSASASSSAARPPSPAAASASAKPAASASAVPTHAVPALVVSASAAPAPSAAPVASAAVPPTAPSASGNTPRAPPAPSGSASGKACAPPEPPPQLVTVEPFPGFRPSVSEPLPPECTDPPPPACETLEERAARKEANRLRCKAATDKREQERANAERKFTEAMERAEEDVKRATKSTGVRWTEVTFTNDPKAVKCAREETCSTVSIERRKTKVICVAEHIGRNPVSWATMGPPAEALKPQNEWKWEQMHCATEPPKTKEQIAKERNEEMLAEIAYDRKYIEKYDGPKGKISSLVRACEKEGILPGDPRTVRPVPPEIPASDNTFYTLRLQEARDAYRNLAHFVGAEVERLTARCVKEPELARKAMAETAKAVEAAKPPVVEPPPVVETKPDVKKGKDSDTARGIADAMHGVECAEKMAIVEEVPERIRVRVGEGLNPELLASCLGPKRRAAYKTGIRDLVAANASGPAVTPYCILAKPERGKSPFSKQSLESCNEATGDKPWASLMAGATLTILGGGSTPPITPATPPPADKGTPTPPQAGQGSSPGPNAKGDNAPTTANALAAMRSQVEAENKAETDRLKAKIAELEAKAKQAPPPVAVADPAELTKLKAEKDAEINSLQGSASDLRKLVGLLFLTLGVGGVFMAIWVARLRKDVKNREREARRVSTIPPAAPRGGDASGVRSNGRRASRTPDKVQAPKQLTSSATGPVITPARAEIPPPPPAREQADSLNDGPNSGPSEFLADKLDLERVRREEGDIKNLLTDPALRGSIPPAEATPVQPAAPVESEPTVQGEEPAASVESLVAKPTVVLGSLQPLGIVVSDGEAIPAVHVEPVGTADCAEPPHSVPTAPQWNPKSAEDLLRPSSAAAIPASDEAVSSETVSTEQSADAQPAPANASSEEASNETPSNAAPLSDVSVEPSNPLASSDPADHGQELGNESAVHPRTAITEIGTANAE